MSANNKEKVVIMNKRIKRTILSCLKFIPDDMYVKLYYKLKTGKSLNLKKPVLYNEKLQWLKLYDHNSLYTIMVDKYGMKEFVSQKVGEKYTIPTLGVWEKFDNIDFNQLPERFVLKCTHDQGSVILCNKNSLNFEKARKSLNYSTSVNYYNICREWPYKNVKPRIIAEPLITDGNDYLLDYKFFCFNGEPKFMYISSDLDSSPTTDFYDMSFKKINMKMRDPNSKEVMSKPFFFDEMKILAQKLSEGIPHLRVDFYFANNNIYVGELTFFPNAGFCKIEPKELEHTLGDWIKLPIE